MLDLGTLGGTDSDGYGINDSGQVTGYSHTTGDAAYHAFLYDGTMHDLGTLGGTYSYGFGINDSGQVTGESDTTGDADYSRLSVRRHDARPGNARWNIQRWVWASTTAVR